MFTFMLGSKAATLTMSVYGPMHGIIKMDLIKMVLIVSNTAILVPFIQYNVIQRHKYKEANEY